MNEQDKRRPLAKKQGGQGGRPVKIIGSKSVQDQGIDEDVLNMLGELGAQDGDFTTTNEPIQQQDVQRQPQPSKQQQQPIQKTRVTSSKIQVIPAGATYQDIDDAGYPPEIDAPFIPSEVTNQQPPLPKVEQPLIQPKVVIEDSGIEFKTKEKAHVQPSRGKTIPVTFQSGQEHRAFRVPLPSKGILYGGAYKDGHINVRPITTKEEAVLYSQGEILNHVNRIINGCVVNPEIDPMELLTCDRFALLLFLRVFSYGSLYEVPFKCTECDSKNMTTVDLVKELEITHMEDGSEEPFEFDFPLSNNFVHFRLLRGGDEAEISKKAKRIMLKSMDDGDPSRIYRWATAIVGINGNEVTFDEALKFVENLLPGDAHAFNDYVDEIEGGIDTTIFRECSFCGATQEFTMPFTAEFFRPTRKRRRRTV